MTNLRDIITSIRQGRYAGNDATPAFVSGDVTAGKVRNAEQKPNNAATAQTNEGDDDNED